MNDLSLKGVARRYLGLGSDFSVKGDVFSVFSLVGSNSLRSVLEVHARKQRSFSMSECIFGWTAAYEQTWTHVIIRIRLNPDAGISAATMATLRTRWENGIEGLWNDHWSCSRSGELPCRLSFEVEWVASGQHHTVRVRPGPGGTNMTLWDTSDSGNVAAHEYGHMFGLVDEYPDSRCPGRSPVSTGTVMHNNTNNVPARMMNGLAANIGSVVVAP